MKRFKDLSDHRLMYAKGVLFVFLAMTSGALLLMSVFTLRNLVLLGLCIWSSCRAYYFAFYVIEHHVDGDFRFRGLIDWVRYLFRR